MFCKNCGTNLPDSARFCNSCGTVVAQEYIVTQPVVQAPKQPNPMIEKFLAVIKNVWARPVATVSTAAKSNTLEWLLFAAAGILTYALGTAVVGLEMMAQLLDAAMGAASGFLRIGAGDLFPFFGIFAVGLLVGAASYFGTACGIWLLVSKIFKKNATFTNALNMVAVATIPLTVIHVANMLFGLIYAPLTLIFFIIAFTMSAICLYVGTQKFDKLEKSPYYGFVVVMAAVILVCCLMGMLYYGVFTSSLESFTANALGSLF